MTKPHGMTGKANARKENPASERIQLNVTPGQKAAIKKRAKAAGLSVSAYALSFLPKQ